MRDRVRANDPIPYEALAEEPRRAFDDFGYFGERYLARERVAWRQEAADR
jgi:hypothetical protein